MDKIVSSKQNVRKTFAQYTHYSVYIPVVNIMEWQHIGKC